MLFLRIKQAEIALKDARLDEAYELLTEKDTQEHRRGQELINQLVQALLDRGKAHLENGQPEHAHTDAAKAQKLGGNLPEAAQLLSEAAEAILNRQRQDRRCNEKLQQARQCIEDGRLSVGEQLLTDTVVNGQHGQALQDRVTQQRARIAYITKQTQSALDRCDLLAAIEVIAKASDAERGCPELAVMVSDIRKLCTDRILQDIQSGRIDMAQTLLDRLSVVGQESMEMRNLDGILVKCRRVCSYISRSQPRRALEILRQLKAVLPEAVWVDDAVAQAEQAAVALEGLGAGPLGLMTIGDSQPRANDGQPEVSDSGDRGKVSPEDIKDSLPGTSGGLAGSFILQVDGVGSYLVVRNSYVTVGPVSSSQKPEIGIIADPSLPVVGIERTEGDYFLRATEAVQVRDHTVKDTLLASGDRIGLSSRCQMQFSIPNAASSTAVLTLTSGRFVRADVRQVILLDREIIVGPGTKSHVRVDAADEAVTLCLKDGRLYCRSREVVKVKNMPKLRVGMPPDRTLGRESAVPMDTPVQVGELSFVITKSE